MLSVFYTQKFDDKPALVSKGRVFSYLEFKTLVFLKIKELENVTASYFALSPEDNFSFIINFFAAVFLRKNIVLLNDFKALKELPLECFVPSEVSSDALLFDKKKDLKELIFPKISLDEAKATLYTSGTTGKPKEIVKTLANIIAEAYDMIYDFDIIGRAGEYQKKGEIFAVAASVGLNHQWGLTAVVFIPFLLQIPVVADRMDYFSNFNVSGYMLVSSPSFLSKFEQHKLELKKYPDIILSAGSVLNKETFDYFISRTKIYDIFGSSECGVVGFRESFEEEYLRTFTNVKVFLADTGEMLVKSPYFTGESIVVGNFVKILGDNKFCIKERSDRVVKISDKRILLSDIEFSLNKNDFVLDSYCLKIDKKLAAIVSLNANGIEFLLQNGVFKTIKNLKTYLLQSFEIVPQRWRFFYEIPKNPMGKPDSAFIQNIFNTNLSLPVILSETHLNSFGEDVVPPRACFQYELYFSKNSNFFKGHFENLPILPGVVQLYYAKFFIDYAFKTKVSTGQIKRIKFSNVIRPDSPVYLRVSEDENNFSFKYFDNETVFSSGVFPKENPFNDFSYGGQE